MRYLNKLAFVPIVQVVDVFDTAQWKHSLFFRMLMVYYDILKSPEFGAVVVEDDELSSFHSPCGTASQPLPDLYPEQIMQWRVGIQVLRLRSMPCPRIFSSLLNRFTASSPWWTQMWRM